MTKMAGIELEEEDGRVLLLQWNDEGDERRQESSVGQCKCDSLGV